MISYKEKLLDPRWQKKRLEVLERDNWTCQSCKETQKTLHVHHQKYSRAPWSIKSDFLITYCERCHSTIEMLIKKIDGFSIKKIKLVDCKSGKRLITAYGVLADNDFGVLTLSLSESEEISSTFIIRESSISKMISEIESVKKLVKS
jgi:hypothetical protein